MSKIIYHWGTGWYFQVDADVYVIDTADIPDLADKLGTIDFDIDMEDHGDEIASQFGKRITNIITEEN